MQTHCHCTEDDRPQHAGVAEGHLEVLAGEDPLADLEGDDVGDQRHREDERRHDGCFARQYESPRRHGGEGRADHAGGVLGGDRPRTERAE